MGRMPFQSCVIKEQEELHKDSSGVVGRRRGKDGLVHRHRGPHTRVQEGKQQQGHFLNVVTHRSFGYLEVRLCL